MPIGVARLGVTCLEKITRSSPITRAMFDILQHDDRVDADVFCQKLGIKLTPLDTTLFDLIGPASEPTS